MSLFFSRLSFFPQQPTEYFDMGIFLAFFVVVSLVCLILLIKIKLKQRRSQVRLTDARSAPSKQTVPTIRISICYPSLRLTGPFKQSVSECTAHATVFPSYVTSHGAAAAESVR